MSQNHTQKSEGRTIFITGAAGYIGGMLIEQLSEREDVDKLICLDMEEPTKELKNAPKTVWLQSNTADEDWRREVRANKPDTVIHCAWQIRELYGEHEKQWRWNVEGSKNVFDLAFSLPSVEKIIYTSTASSYGAFKSNSIEHRFKEEEPFREKEYLYGIEKKVTEKNLEERYESSKEDGNTPEVTVLRLAAVTGPKGRSSTHKFGLMPALSKRLPKGFVYRMVSAMITFIPATSGWCRQFVHEDDVADIISFFTFKEKEDAYEVFNVAPPGPPVLSKDMAEILDRGRIPVTPLMVRSMFFMMRTLTLGKIPTTKGGWRFYSYPIVMDGSKLTEKHGYNYRCGSREALEKNEGRYATDPSQ